MKKSTVIVTLGVFLALFITGCFIKNSGTDTFSDTLELTAEKTTIEEASNILRINIPMPGYLPEIYKYQEIYLEVGVIRIIFSNIAIEKKLITRSSISGTYQQYEFQCPMEINITWNSQGIPGGLKFTGGGESIKITPYQGVVTSSLLVDKENHNELWWEWRPDVDERGMFRIGIAASKSIKKEELVRVAESFR